MQRAALDDLAEIHRAELHLGGACVGFGEEEHVFNQLFHMIGFFLGAFQPLPLLGDGGALVREHDVVVRQNDRQRRFQLMGRVGDKLLLLFPRCLNGLDRQIGQNQADAEDDRHAACKQQQRNEDRIDERGVNGAVARKDQTAVIGVGAHGEHQTVFVELTVAAAALQRLLHAGGKNLAVDRQIVFGAVQDIAVGVRLRDHIGGDLYRRFVAEFAVKILFELSVFSGRSRLCGRLVRRSRRSRRLRLTAGADGRGLCVVILRGKVVLTAEKLLRERLAAVAELLALLVEHLVHAALHHVDGV